jgi:hypothetical protein
VARIVIHIGLPKTATTTLQQRVFPAHPDMLYLGPKADFAELDELMKAVCFAEGLNYDSEHTKRSLARLLSSLPPDKRPRLISLETLTAHGQDRLIKATRLQQLLPDAQIILTIRRPEDLLPSMYFQWLKGLGGKFRSPMSLDGWLEHEWENRWSGAFLRLQFAKILGTYRALFGKASVLLLFYEELVIDLPRFASRLSNFIGVDEFITAQLLSGGKANPRMTKLRYSEVQLYGRFPWLKPIAGLRRLLPDPAKVVARRLLQREASAALSPDWRRSIRDYARRENQALLAEFPELSAHDYF